MRYKFVVKQNLTIEYDREVLVSGRMVAITGSTVYRDNFRSCYMNRIILKRSFWCRQDRAFNAGKRK